MAITLYSKCHFAETFNDHRIISKEVMQHTVMRCSFCGEPCEYTNAYGNWMPTRELEKERNKYGK